MVIVGGSYREVCEGAGIDRVWGSGGRAAAAVARLSPGSSLHTFAYRGWSTGVRSSMAAFGVQAHVREIDEEITFAYLHQMSLWKAPEPRDRTGYGCLEATGDVALAFGMVEGVPAVKARRAVFDPQADVFAADGRIDARAMLGQGSRPGELAYVIPDYALGLDPADRGAQAVARLRYQTGARVVVVRDAVCGADVYVGDARPTRVPAYHAGSWSRIGVGDVFSAAFALHWGEVGRDAAVAADLAARAVAEFADGHRLPLTPGPTPAAEPRDGPQAGLVGLVGPDATLAQRWLLWEAYGQLRTLLRGREEVVFLQSHDGRAPPGEVVVVLALVDGGDARTNAVVGRARACRVPVVVLAEGTAPRDLTMPAGDECDVVHDLASAVYRAFMAARRPARP